MLSVHPRLNFTLVLYIPIPSTFSPRSTTPKSSPSISSTPPMAPSPSTPLPSKPTTWAEIPADILVVIISLLCVRDRFFCRLVCRAWAAAERLLPPPRELPWLMLSRLPDTTSQRFFCLSGSTTIQVSFPDGLREAICCGSFSDSLVFNDGVKIACLLNPVSKSLKPLSDMVGYPYLLNYQGVDDLATPHYLRKVIFSSPSEFTRLASEPCFVAAIYDQGLVLHGWILLNGLIGEDFIIEDILFDQTRYTKLWAISIHEKIFVHELSNASVSRLSIEKRVEQELDLVYKKHVYLVQFCGNHKIAMVLRYYEGEASDESTITFRVYELEMNPNPPDFMDPDETDGCWVEKNSLDGHAIFLSSNCSKAILASKYEGLEEDKIYFADEIRFANDRSRDQYECGDVGFFSLKDGSITKLIENRVNSFNSPPTWFFHSNEW